LIGCLKEEGTQLQEQAMSQELENSRAKVLALEREVKTLRKKIDDDKKVKNITKMQQEIEEKSEAVPDELELDLEEEKANEEEPVHQLKKSKPPQQIIQELTEANQDLELRLEEEKAINSDWETKLRTLELTQNKELEALRTELRNRDQKIKEMESQKAKTNKDIQDSQLIRASAKDKVTLDLEELLRQIYFHLGGGLHMEDVEEEHRENVRFLDIVGDLIRDVKQVAEDLTENYYRDPIPSSANADDIRDYVLRIRRFKGDIKKERNDFVRSCNKLGEHYESKSSLEQSLEMWKGRLLEIVGKGQHPPGLDKDLAEVRRILKEDTNQQDEVRANRKDKLFARIAVDKKIGDLRRYTEEELHYNENKRLRELLTDLKETNKRLQSSNQSAGLQPNNLSREQSEKISHVIGLMIQNSAVLFKEHSTGQNLQQVHPMVRRPIQYLEKRGIRQRNILEPTSSGTHAEVQELKERFYSGEDVVIPPGTDPRVVAELLREYFRDLKQPLCTYKRYESFSQISDMPPSKQLSVLRTCIDELPKVRRATLTVLMEFLHKVKSASMSNGMNTDKLADIFGPLLLRPLQDR